MLGKFGRHVRGNVVAYVALLLALGLGTAWGAGLAKNSVRSKQIKDGQVKSVDLANGGVRGLDVSESSLGQVPSAAQAESADELDGKDSAEFAPAAAEAWREVGSTGQPQFRPADGVNSSGNCDSAGGCVWSNYESGQHNSAAFYRDPYGQVHIKGLVCRAYKFVVDAGNSCPPSVSGAGAGTDDIFQLPSGYRPAGIVEVAGSSAGDYARVEIKPDGTVSAATPYNYGNLFLDNISFRCSPAGQNGCP